MPHLDLDLEYDDSQPISLHPTGLSLLVTSNDGPLGDGLVGQHRFYLSSLDGVLDPMVLYIRLPWVSPRTVMGEMQLVLQAIGGYSIEELERPWTIASMDRGWAQFSSQIVNLQTFRAGGNRATIKTSPSQQSSNSHTIQLPYSGRPVRLQLIHARYPDVRQDVTSDQHVSWHVWGEEWKHAVLPAGGYGPDGLRTWWASLDPRLQWKDDSLVCQSTRVCSIQNGAIRGAHPYQTGSTVVVDGIQMTVVRVTRDGAYLDREMDDGTITVQSALPVLWRLPPLLRQLMGVEQSGYSRSWSVEMNNWPEALYLHCREIHPVQTAGDSVLSLLWYPRTKTDWCSEPLQTVWHGISPGQLQLWVTLPDGTEVDVSKTDQTVSLVFQLDEQ